jgi:nitroimidazol reductase NimA-like FMN-containing flavoprotein (pyridoxamine 5'-phosphate oxidase superfamily)
LYPNFPPNLKKGRHSQYLPMTGAESWAFIKSHYKMVLCSLDSDGFPHAAPIWFVVLDDRIYFRAQPYKKKIKNIMNRPQVCGVIEDGEKYTELRGVMIRGLAKIVDSDKPLRKRIFELLAEKYSPVRNTNKFPRSWQETYGKEHRVVVEFKPTSIVSWDNRKWISHHSVQKEKRNA